MSAWRRLIAFRDDAPKPSLYEQGLEAGLTLWAWGLFIAALFEKVPYEVVMAYVGLLLLALPIRRRVMSEEWVVFGDELHPIENKEED